VLAQIAGQVAGSADKVVEQLAALRQDLHDATTQANQDIAAAKKKAAAEVAAERRDRRRANWKFGIVVALDIALSAVSLGLYVDQRDTDARLRQTQQAVLCPLYTLFVSAVQTAPPGETPAQHAIRLAAQNTVRRGYRALGCKPPLPAVK
jgi:hypothetical protein